MPTRTGSGTHVLLYILPETLLGFLAVRIYVHTPD